MLFTQANQISDDLVKFFDDFDRLVQNKLTEEEIEGGWQNVKTMPKDGKPFLSNWDNPNGNYTGVIYYSEYAEFWCDDYYPFDENITEFKKWKPLESKAEKLVQEFIEGVE